MGSRPWRAAALFAAHKALLLHTHERDRALQRLLLCALVLVLMLAAEQLGAVNTDWSLLTLTVSLYALANVLYLALLRERPTGFPVIQYLFLLSDPWVAVGLLAYQPTLFAWIPGLLLIEVTRCGLRFGKGTLWLEWASAVLGAAVILGSSAGQRIPWGDIVTLVAFLSVGVVLFLPLIDAQASAERIVREQARLEALAQTVAEKSLFLSKVSHELRSPLQTILSALDVLEWSSRSARPHEQRRALDPSGGVPVMVERMQRAATALSRQLSDLLTLTRSEAAGFRLRPAPADLSALVLSVVRDKAEAAGNKGLQIEALGVEGAPCHVVVDAGRVGQVLENLLSNAIKYTPAGSVSLESLGVNARGDEAKFRVSDTGLGMGGDELARMFGPFERGTEGEGKVEGSGLGLAVVRALLRNLGGDIDVSSTPGLGTVATVTVPVAAPLAGDRGLGRRVLVIDDRFDVASGLQAVLEQMKCVVDLAQSSGAASNFLAARSYAMVLFDLDMPLRTGVQLASETRSGQGPNARAKLVAITAGDVTEAQTQLIFDIVLQKPVTARVLKSIMDGGSPAPART